MSRAHASASRRCSDARSASTWSRSSPRSDRALARCSSASRTRCSSEARHAGRSASRAASCSEVASPSASAPTYMSSCQGLSVVGAVTGAPTPKSKRNLDGEAHRDPSIRSCISPAGRHVGGLHERPRRRTSYGFPSGIPAGPVPLSDPDHPPRRVDGRGAVQGQCRRTRALTWTMRPWALDAPQRPAALFLRTRRPGTRAVTRLGCGGPPRSSRRRIGAPCEARDRRPRR